MSLKSNLGIQLRRAELYSTGSDGRPIPALSRHHSGIRVRETRSYSPAQLHALEEQAERAGREAALRAALTDDEKRILALQERVELREVKQAIGEAQLEGYLAAGWQLVRRARGRAHVVKAFVAAPTYAEIAEVLALSVRQVHRRVVSAHRKLRGTR
jgi:hypothetical protein